MWGFVSDRLGRVRTMRLTLLLAGILTLSSALAWRPVSLGITRGLAGGFFGAAYPATLIYLGDTVPAASRQRVIARLMVGVALGTALASVGAGVLADVATWRAAFVITGVASLVLSRTLRRLPEPDLAQRPVAPAGSTARDPPLPDHPAGAGLRVRGGCGPARRTHPAATGNRAHRRNRPRLPAG